MRILVTGCAGYLGSTLVRQLLQDGHTVFGIDTFVHHGQGILDLVLGWGTDERFHFFAYDITDGPLMAGVVSAFKVDVIIHLAAFVGEPLCKRIPDRARKVNVDGTKNLLCSTSTKFIFASTCSVYGSRPGQLLTEESPVEPIGVYGETKVEAEKLVLEAGGTVLRFGTLYGPSPRMRFDTLLNELVHFAISTGEIEIWNPGEVRPLVSVQEVCHLFEFLLPVDGSEWIKKREGEILNIPGTNISKGELGRLVRNVTHCKVKTKITDGPMRDYSVSGGKLESTGFYFPRSMTSEIQRIYNLLESKILSDPNSREWRNT